MKLRLRRYLIKLALFLLRSCAILKTPLNAASRHLKKPLSPVGNAVYGLFFNLYRLYFLFRRHILKVVPSKDILGISTNKFIIHAVIIVIAVATASQNIYARSVALGDYGKNSILFSLTQPKDEEETVEGLPIHSDIENDMSEGEAAFGEAGMPAENYSTLGFIGADYSPTTDTQNTRTSIEYYIVQKGETLGGIAQKYGISLNTLLWANQLTERSYIRPGDKLTILPVSGVAHTVKKGDTLAAIASKYRADQEKISEFNRLADGGLQAGQVLIVPEGRIIYVAPTRVYESGYSSKTYASSGSLLWPVPSRRITQYYSWRHPAIDVGLPSGSRLVATEAGKIIYSGWGSGYGYEVLIDHGKGLKTRYAHCSRLYVRAGDVVEQGQLIALTGNTGWSTGPHLHFEVYVGGARQNPLLYVK